MSINSAKLTMLSICLSACTGLVHAVTCNIAAPVLPCDLTGAAYDTFAGNYSGARLFYKADSYTTTIQDGYLGLTLKEGRPHSDGFAYVAGYGVPVWTSPEPYNVGFAVFGQFNGASVQLANHFEWYGNGAGASTNYGLFIGALDPGTSSQAVLRSDVMATRLANAFSTRPASQAFVLTGDLTPLQDGSAANPILLGEIQSKLTDIRSRMKPGDTFTLYLGGHGGSLGPGGNSGDEAVRVGDMVSDNWLTSQLGQFEGFRKTTFIDACRSGGFWGSGDLTESEGVVDLEQLTNIALFSAAREYNSTYYRKSDGLLFYSLAIEEALLDLDDRLSATALSERLYERTRAYSVWPHNIDPYFIEADFGDAVLVDPDLFKLSFIASGDFDPNAPVFAVPEANSGLLFLVGLLILRFGFARQRARGRF